MNDNIPQCSTVYSEVSIPENFPIDKPIIKINATDLDKGVNGTINYKFRTNSTWPFYINKTTGEIYSKDLFDYESDFKQFLITIDLEDTGNPIKNQNKNSCQVELFLEDVNDNRPELIDDKQTKIFIDLEKPFENEILSFNITDKDSGINGKIKYSLQSIESNINLNNNNQTLFSINQNGTLFMLYKINQICLFKLRILLEDYGYPSQQTLIEINVAFGNLLDPRYSSFENIEKFFEEKISDTNNIALILGLTVLIITFILLMSITVICILFRRQNQRHKAAIISRNRILCLSSQQLTTSDSTVTSNTTSSSIEHQQILRVIVLFIYFLNLLLFFILYLTVLFK